MHDEVPLACFATLEGAHFTIGNALVRRSWRVQGGGLHAVELTDLSTGRNWIEPGALPEADSRSAVLETQAGPGMLTARLVFGEAGSGCAFTVWERSSAIRMQALGAVGQEGEAAQPAGRADEPTGVEEAEGVATGAHAAVEEFVLNSRHVRLVQVEFRDQTDAHNQLVFEREWLPQGNERYLALPGNLFVLEDPLTREGLVFLKEAPLPHARPVRENADFELRAGERRARLLGRLNAVSGAGYAWTVLPYTGGKAGRTRALQRYQMCLRPHVPGRDGQFLSNTWGDRNKDGRVREDFMRREIQAAAQLGVDVVQIDDGWQRGRSANSVEAGGVWEGFYAADPEFWAPHPERFPRGLAPLAEAAAREGLRLGLWIAPDSAREFANWERDAAMVLRYHRELGICHFKVDGVKARTELGLGRLEAFFARCREESGDAIVFDLDVTAEIRPGYWGLMTAGPLFVENRYTDWRGYWPHQTLRNLWSLAHYVHPARLRMEFLNHARNMEKYAGDPLAPAEYSPGYLFATVMFASPLGWFEVSSLPDSYFEEVAPLVAIWKRHRDAIYSGMVLPLGAAPDGTSWTGFAAFAPEGGVYVLVFRELNAEASAQMELPGGPDEAAEFTLLAGDSGGVVRWLGDGLEVTMPEARRFLFGWWPGYSVYSSMCSESTIHSK